MNLYQSTKVESLLQKLSENILLPPTTGSFDWLAEEWVLVENPAMAQWLEIQLAEKNSWCDFLHSVT